MTEPLTVVKPCVRECARVDGAPLGATHGQYCARCWGRLNTSIAICGELAQHLVGNGITGASADGDRVDNTREAPVPFNAAAFDDASELYSALVYWTEVWAAAMRTPAPSPEPDRDENGYPTALRYGARRGTWRNERGRIVGLPAGTTATDAGLIVGKLAAWIRDRLDTILSLGHHDDVDAFTDTITDVWRMNARWPRIERPSYSAMPCPRDDCGAKIAVYPPAYPGDDRRIVCTAGHWYPEEEYEHLRLVFEQVAKDHERSIKVATRLAKKYGIGA